MKWRNPFRMRTAAEMAQRQLEDAEREWLMAQHEFDRASASVVMYDERVSRLRRLVTDNATRIAETNP